MLFPVLLAVLCQAKAPTHEQLISAIRRNDRPAVESILATKPALVNERDGPREGDWSGPILPLECAAGMRAPEMVKLLLEKGAKVDARGVNEFTALHLARDAETVRILLARGADPHARGAFEMTPLALASTESKVEVIEALIDAGVHHDVASALQLGLRDEALAVAKFGPLPSPEQRSVSMPQFAQDPLCIAAGCGELEIVKVLLDRGMSIDVPARFMVNGGPYSALNYAVWGDHEDVARLLLESGASINMGGAYKFGGDLLDFAVQRSSPAMVRLLLEHGAKGGRTAFIIDPPLHVAAWLGRSDIVEVLVRAGFDPRASVEGASPLFLAALGGHEDTVCLLEAHGAFLDVFAAAALGREQDVARFISSNPAWALETDDRLGLTALHYAVHFRNIAIVRLLLDAGADPNSARPAGDWPNLPMDTSGMSSSPRGRGWTPNPELVTPLWFAVAGKDREIVRLLLDTGADPNTRCIGGNAVLHDTNSDPETIRALLDCGAVVDALNDEGWTPLMGSPWIRHVESALERARILLDHGADPNHVAKQGATPLSLCRYSKATDPLALLLIERGATVDFFTACWLGLGENVKRQLKEDPKLATSREPGNAGLTACGIAARRGHLGVLRQLVEAGADPLGAGDDSPIVLAARHGQTGIVRELIGRGADLKASYGFSRPTLLHLAAQSDSPDLVELLIDEGLDVNSVDDSKRTPLHEAAGCGSSAVVHELLRAGAKVDVRDDYHQTPVWSVLYRLERRGDLEIMRLLVEAGADVNARDNHGRTLIDRVEELRGNWFAVEPRVESYLRSVGAKRSR